MSNQEPYCGVIVQTIDRYYREHIYVNITKPICLVGMILNLLNILVFTRKPMKSPPNLILTHLAFVDFLFLLSTSAIAQFWPFTVQFQGTSDQHQSYGWTIFYWYNNIFLCTVQFISAFLTVQLAAWRYIAVVHPLKERHWCTKKITRNVVFAGYIVCCVLFAIPYHLSLDIVPRNTNGKTYYIGTFERHPIIYSIAGIVFGLLSKILPSFLLAGLTSRIIIALFVRKTQRKQLGPPESTRSSMKNVETRQQTNRLSAILLTVVALFFIGDFPRGMLWLLRTINERDWGTCYDSLVKILMTITNINTSITFMVYYTLSQQFRTAFKSLFMFILNKRAISHQTHTSLASGDTEVTELGRRTSEF